MHNEETYELFQRGRAHLENGDNAQATVSLEKAKRREPDKNSIREALGVRVARGSFGAHMRVSLVNDGPVTIWLDTAEW